jgi:hypothetical protein
LSAARGVEVAETQENEADQVEQVPEGQRVELPIRSDRVAQVIAEAREGQSILERLERLGERAADR